MKKNDLEELEKKFPKAAELVKKFLDSPCCGEDSEA